MHKAMKVTRLIGGAFVLMLAVFPLGVISCGQLAEPEIHLIPAGYMGNVYIFHNVPDGEPLIYEGRARVYKIPTDGILRSQGPANQGSILRLQYFYVRSDGKRERITGYWPTSIHDTAENRADATLGIFFPRMGGSLTRFTLRRSNSTTA
jgi:hypothetical protein